MSGYEIEELARIEAALDDLVSPTSEDVFQATRPFDERAIASVAATRGGSGGAQPVVLAAQVTLTDAQIKNLGLGVNPLVEIVPAPGAGEILVYLSGAIRSDTSAGAYTNIAASAALWCDLNGTAASVLVKDSDAASVFVISDILGGHGKYCTFLPAEQAWAGQPLAAYDQEEEVTAGAALGFSGSNGGQGAFTGGNAANTMTVVVYYAVFTLPT